MTIYRLLHRGSVDKSVVSLSSLRLKLYNPCSHGGAGEQGAKEGGEEMERMTVQEAADYLKISVQQVRYMMDIGKLKIGMVVRHKKRNTYLIYRELLEGVKLT